MGIIYLPGEDIVLRVCIAIRNDIVKYRGNFCHFSSIFFHHGTSSISSLVPSFEIRECNKLIENYSREIY